MPNIDFKSVSHPFFVQDKIYELKGHKEKADETKKDNERKEELHLWFGKVIGKLEQIPQIKGAPNLQRLDFIEAMERAGELGFQVVVWDEDPSHPELPPGVVIYQNPPPGTVINPGGEIQVVLTS
ncbi:MAG: PASTA domain-containing protein [Chloroflexi bacterium]|nr:MAG: PASTA domain-containing protein [Chloroflexota bacterium]